MTPGQLFIWVMIVVGGLVAANTLRELYLWRRDAVEEWARRREAGPAATGGLSRDRFMRVYFHAHGPRGPVYAVTTVIAAALATPLALVLLAQVWRVFWVLSGKPMPFAAGTHVWSYYMFFGLIGCWAGLAALAAHRFHTRRPGSLDEELARAGARG